MIVNGVIYVFTDNWSVDTLTMSPRYVIFIHVLTEHERSMKRQSAIWLLYVLLFIYAYSIFGLSKYQQYISSNIYYNTYYYWLCI